MALSSIRILVWTIRLSLDSDIDTDWLLSELKPFRKAKNTFWSSSGLEDTRKLGYTYPDFNGIKEPGNPDAVREWISNRVNLLYGRDLSSTPSPECPDHGAWDWIVRMEFKSFEYNGMGFYVYIFLGEVPENFQDWDSCNNYVGSAFAFVNSVPERCSNCISQQDLFVEQFVHLDPAIVRHGGLRSLEPDVVEPYLTNSLKWKVQKVLFILFFYIFQCMLIIHFISINSVKRRTGGPSVSSSLCNSYSVDLPPRHQVPCSWTASSLQRNHARKTWRLSSCLIGSELKKSKSSNVIVVLFLACKL